jgi:hypothetical protein
LTQPASPASGANLEYPTCAGSLHPDGQCIFPAPDLPGSRYRCVYLGYGSTAWNWWTCNTQACQRPRDACLAGTDPVQEMV